jgi:ABC-2 type transport system ATP-binding protein
MSVDINLENSQASADRNSFLGKIASPLKITALVKDYPSVKMKPSAKIAMKSAPGSVPNSSTKSLPTHANQSDLFRAVDGVDLEVKQGEIFGLLGPNGSGKTTIISTIVTLQEPTSGSVEVFGYNVEKNPNEAKMLTGYVPQELIHHGFFNVAEIMRFHSGYFGRNHNQERIDWLLHKLSLYEQRHKKVKQLSGGMKRRLLIAKALVHEPKILLLDEPTAGVDVELRNSLWEFVTELKKSGMTILLTTHYLEEAEELCDRVGILQRGKLQRLGQTKELIRDLTQREIRIIVKLPTAKALAHAALIEKMDVEKGTALTYSVSANTTCGTLLDEVEISGKDIIDISTREGSLEDVLLRVLGDGQ